MSLFYKKKKGNLQKNGFPSKSSDHFKAAVESGKLKIASWLNHKTSSYTSFQKKIALVIFCILFGGISFLILIQSIHDRNFKRQVLIITHLRSGVPPAHPHILDSVFNRIEKAKHLLDSLRNNNTLKFKAILLNRPTLFNNLQLLEKIY